MSDAPERIWAWRFHSGARNEHMDGGLCQQPDARETEYRRADLPPTLAQAMMVPEVRELVEAFKVLLEAHESGWIAGEDWGAAERARAALHRILAALEPVPLRDEALIRATEEIQRLRYVLEGVAGAIDTGRNEPLVIWREQINIALEATDDATIAGIMKRAKA